LSAIASDLHRITVGDNFAFQLFDLRALDLVSPVQSG
jgi:hypothetical protein